MKCETELEKKHKQVKEMFRYLTYENEPLKKWNPSLYTLVGCGTLVHLGFMVMSIQMDLYPWSVTGLPAGQESRDGTTYTYRRGAMAFSGLNLLKIGLTPHSYF